MLFLLKRTWRGGFLGLIALVPLGLALRYHRDDVPAVGVSWDNLGWGVVVFALLLVNDLLLHVSFLTWFRDAYLRRGYELARLFKEQSGLALLLGALLAGLGEELLFRGFTTRWELLALAALPFALLHHVRSSLWLFTLWAGYQGLFLALVLHLSGYLFVPMTAHFLHDCCGFLAFRVVNRSLTTQDGSP